MTNPQYFKIAGIMSLSYCPFTLQAFKKYTCILLCMCVELRGRKDASCLPHFLAKNIRTFGSISWVSFSSIPLEVFWGRGRIKKKGTKHKEAPARTKFGWNEVVFCVSVFVCVCACEREWEWGCVFCVFGECNVNIGRLIKWMREGAKEEGICWYKFGVNLCHFVWM